AMSTSPLVRVNQTSADPAVNPRDTFACEFAATRSSGNASPASRNRFHWTKYSPATSLLLTRMALLTWVQRPVGVQFVLPVQTCTGLKTERTFLHTTRNLLWPRMCGGSIRLKTRTADLTSRPRAALFSSSPAAFVLPFERTTWA